MNSALLTMALFLLLALLRELSHVPPGLEKINELK